MLVPKRVKHRKVQRGSMKGKAKGGTRLNHGEYGIQALEAAWITNRQIETTRIEVGHMLVFAQRAEYGVRRTAYAAL